MRSHSPPVSPVRHVPVDLPRRLDEEDYLLRGIAPPPKEKDHGSLTSIHAIHGAHRHIGGRWHCRFDHVEAETGRWRRRLECAERQGAGSGSSPWALRVKLIDKYVARAVPLLRGSGFVEAFHLLQGALELSLHDGEGFGTGGERQQLVAQADTKHRNIGFQHVLYRLDGVVAGFRVTRAIG